MKIVTNSLSLRSSLAGTALAALASAFLLVVAPVPSLKAEPAAATLPAVHLTPKVEKVKDADKGPYVLHLKNPTKAPITASAKVLLAVAFHAESKARLVPETTVEPGKVWTITGLVADDKVIVTSTGSAPLEVVIH